MAAADSNERTFSITQVRAVTPGGNSLALGTVLPRALYVGVSGDVTIQAADDAASTTLVGLAAGMWHPISCQKITAATATGVLVGY
jgi:hypothetical protein